MPRVQPLATHSVNFSRLNYSNNDSGYSASPPFSANNSAQNSLYYDYSSQFYNPFFASSLASPQLDTPHYSPTVAAALPDIGKKSAKSIFKPYEWLFIFILFLVLCKYLFKNFLNKILK